MFNPKNLGSKIWFQENLGSKNYGSKILGPKSFKGPEKFVRKRFR